MIDPLALLLTLLLVAGWYAWQRAQWRRTEQAYRAQLRRVRHHYLTWAGARMRLLDGRRPSRRVTHRHEES